MPHQAFAVWKIKWRLLNSYTLDTQALLFSATGDNTPKDRGSSSGILSPIIRGRYTVTYLLNTPELSSLGVRIGEVLCGAPMYGTGGQLP